MKERYFLIILLLAITTFTSCTDESVDLYNQGMNKMNEPVKRLEDMEPNYLGALSFFDRSIAKNPNYADAYKKRACVKLALRDFNGARQDADKVLQLEPDDKAAHYFIGRLEFFKGDYNASLKTFNDALSTDAGFADGYLSRAMTEAAMKNRDAALKDYNKAIALSDNDTHFKAVCYDLRGVFYEEAGDKNAACADFNRAADLGYRKAKIDIKVYCQ